jgi:hypothetical protein
MKKLSKEEKQFRSYIKKEFGGLQELADFLGINYQSVINALNSENVTGWVKLLKYYYLSKDKYRIVKKSKLANTQGAAYLFDKLGLETNFAKFHNFRRYEGNSLDFWSLEKKNNEPLFYIVIAKHETFRENKKLLIEMLDSFFTSLNDT